MLIGNLPIAGNVPTAVHNENRQRVSQFKALENALLDGDGADARASGELLSLATANSAQSAQKQRQFGYSNYTGQQFEVLENALKNGDLEGAREALIVLRREEESEHQQKRDPGPEPENRTDNPEAQQSPASTSTHSNVGGTFDALA